jgi:hypothetical protein
MEILQANADVLRDPELLPLDKQIRIPERPATNEPNPAPSAGPTVEEPPITTLVPIQ